MGKVGFGELAFWLVTLRRPTAAGDAGLRGGAGRACRPRLHTDRDRRAAHLPLRARLAPGRARRRAARGRVTVPRRDRGLRPVPARRPRGPAGRPAHRRRRVGRARPRRRTTNPRGRARSSPVSATRCTRCRTPHAAADRDRRGGGAARPAPAALRGDRTDARAGARAEASAQRRGCLRRRPRRPRPAGRPAARLRAARPRRRPARPDRRGGTTSDRDGRLPHRRPQRGLRRPRRPD